MQAFQSTQSLARGEAVTAPGLEGQEEETVLTDTRQPESWRNVFPPQRGAQTGCRESRGTSAAVLKQDEREVLVQP